MIGEFLKLHPLGVAIGLVSAWAAYKFFKFLELRRKIPPGPFPLPIVGNMLRTMLEKFDKFAKKYGDPMSIWFGHKLTVVATSKEMIREAIVTQQAVTCSRQDSPIVDYVFRDSTDIAMGKYGPTWRIHRKLANRSMRHLIEASILEEKVNNAVVSVTEALIETGGKPVSPVEYISNVVFNVICSFAYGKSYSVDDPEYLRLLYLNKASNEAFTEVLVYDFLPGSKYMPLKALSGRVREACKLFDELADFVRARVKDHRETYQKGEIRDFIDSMIMEQDLLREEGEEKLKLLDDNHLALVVLDFFNAGTDTTSSVLTWLFLYFAVNPDFQKRCQEQIKEVLGERSPSLADRGKLPLVEACILEALRLRSPAPLAIPHVPISDFQLGGYTVPAGSMIMPNIHSMHTDPRGDFPKDPKNFSPEKNFLEEDGESVRKPQGFMPFGGGRRVCLGEQLAKNDLFLITTGLLQKLNFSTVEGEKYTTEPDPKVDGILYAQHYVLSITARE